MTLDPANDARNLIVLIRKQLIDIEFYIQEMTTEAMVNKRIDPFKMMTLKDMFGNFLKLSALLIDIDPKYRPSLEFISLILDFSGNYSASNSQAIN